MRKTFLLLFALLLSSTIFAQDEPTNIIIGETFDSTELPEGWTTMRPDGTESLNWNVSQTNHAGGDSNEAHLYWYPQFVGTTRLVSAPVNLTGIQEIVITMDHYFENYNNAYNTIGIATSSDYGYTWHSVWEHSYSVTGRYSIEEKILTPDMGYENVLFCIYFDGSSSSFQNWYFDNFFVKIQDDLSFRMNSININDRIGSGPLNIGFSVQNMGSTAITNFDATYEIEGQEPVTESFSVYMTSFETNNITFTNTETLLPGTYDITISIGLVNGWEENPEGNEMSKEFSVAIAETQRIPMIEHFSSSTCAPCVLLNQLMLNLTNSNPGKYCYVKYPVNWPGTGDPYYIQECYDRCIYYGVASVPLIFLDAEAQVSNQTAQPVTTNNLMMRYNTPAFADIRGAFNVEGNTINLSADVMSYIDLNDVRTFITINEKVTTENTVEYGGNGETEFRHIMMKMVESGDGIETDIEAGKYHKFEYSFDMSETNVEEMNDLEVAVWLQDPNTKEIFNSHFLYEYTDHPYAVENLHFNKGSNYTLTWNKAENAAPTGYNVYINRQLVASNISETSYTVANVGDFCLAEVVALYNDKNSVSSVALYSSDFVTPQNLTATVNTGNITLSWDAIEDADEYVLYRDGQLLANNLTSTEYIDTEVENNTTYCYQVGAVYGRYESALSEEVCKLYGEDGVEEIESNISISPNPANNFVRISGNNVKEINIYNSVGILVDRFNVEDNIISINVENYSTGIYFVNIKSNQEDIIKKLIIK